MSKRGPGASVCCRRMTDWPSPKVYQRFKIICSSMIHLWTCQQSQVDKKPFSEFYRIWGTSLKTPAATHIPEVTNKPVCKMIEHFKCSSVILQTGLFYVLQRPTNYQPCFDFQTNCSRNLHSARWKGGIFCKLNIEQNIVCNVTAFTVWAMVHFCLIAIRPEQNGWHFVDDIFQIDLIERKPLHFFKYCWNWLNWNLVSFVQVMAWPRRFPRCSHPSLIVLKFDIDLDC